MGWLFISKLLDKNV